MMTTTGSRQIWYHFVLLSSLLVLTLGAPYGSLARPDISTAEQRSVMKLQGCRVAIIIAEGYHEHEFWYPYYRFLEEGADVIVAGPEKGTVHGEGRHGKDGLPATITHAVSDIAAESFDMIYLPGGLWSPMRLRVHQPTLDLVRKSIEQDVLVAAICHAPWILVSADVVRGRKIACPSDMAIDVTNAGGIFVKQPAVRDGNLITAIYFGCLPDHFRLVIPALLEKRQQKQSQ
jgi:protease I